MVDVALLFSAYVVLVVSLGISVQSGDGQWFNRAGSLTVLFGAICEYRLAKYIRDRTEYRGGPIRMSELATASNLSSWQKTVLWFSHAAIIVGTIIWGYGDLLFK